METFIIALIVLLLELLFIELLPESRKTKNKLELILVFVQLFILAGWRDLSILNDTKPYAIHFEKLHRTFSSPFYSIDTSDRFENGYLIFEKFVYKHITSSILGYNILTAFIILLGTFYFFYKYSQYIWLTLFLYVSMRIYFTEIGVLRQALALLAGYISFYYLLKRKYLQYTIAVLLACSFHNSGWFFFLFFVIFHLKESKRTYILLFISIFIFFLFYGSIAEKYLNITDSKYYQVSLKKNHFSLLGLFSTINSGFLLLIILYLKKKIKQITFLEKKMFLLAFLFFLISIMSIRLFILLRFEIYILPFLIVLISNLVYRIHKPSIKYTIIAILIIYTLSITFFILYTHPEWISIYPYKFYE